MNRIGGILQYLVETGWQRAGVFHWQAGDRALLNRRQADLPEQKELGRLTYILPHLGCDPSQRVARFQLSEERDFLIGSCTCFTVQAFQPLFRCHPGRVSPCRFFCAERYFKLYAVSWPSLV